MFYVSRYRTFALEGLLLLSVCALLMQWAAPLTELALHLQTAGGADGGGALRYRASEWIVQAQSLLPHALGDWVPMGYHAFMGGESWWRVTALTDAQRALYLLWQTGPLMTMMAVLAWAGIGAAHAQRPWSLGAILAFGSAAATWVMPFGMAPRTWLLTGALGALLWLLGVWVGRRDTTPLVPAQKSGWHALMLPLWALLTGLGFMWIADFSVNGPLVPHGSATDGPAGSRYFFLQQMDGLWAANTLWALMASRGTQLLAWMMRTTNQSLGGRAGAHNGQGTWLPSLALALSLALVAGWVGHPKRTEYLGLLPGLGMPHVSAEVLRVAIAAVFAWLIYRYGEHYTSAARLRKAIFILAGVLVVLLMGHLLSQDVGPIQVMAVQAAVVAALAVGLLISNAASAQRARAWVWALTGGMVVAALLMVAWGQRQMAPLSATGACRALPAFEQCSSNLAKATWLMDAAPPGGFGLGQTPFCGARSVAYGSPCTQHSGAPIQLPSDFATAGLVAVYGPATAAALLGALCVWLCVVVVAASHAGAQNNPVSRYSALLASGLALTAAANALASVGGTLGLTLLTGVTLPLLGYGASALVVLGLMAGLVPLSKTNLEART